MTLSDDQFKGHLFRQTYESEHGSANVTPGGYVYNLGIKPENRGQGHGTTLMRQITEHADLLGKPLMLHAREGLHPWYHRLGFEQDTSPGAGVEKDIWGQALLVRKPSTPPVQTSHPGPVSGPPRSKRR